MDTTKLQKLIDNRVKVAAGGGEAAVEKHHAKGSYTARERINMFTSSNEPSSRSMLIRSRAV